MSIFELKKMSREYADEVKKQTDTYGYFCKMEEVKKGERNKDGSPSFCIVNKLYDLIFDDSKSKEALNTEYYFICVNATYDSDAMAEELISNPDTELLYYDEDYVTDTRRHTPFFKPCMSEETLLGANYIGNSFVVKREVAETIIEKIRADYPNGYPVNNEELLEDTLRYDFLLRLTEEKIRVRNISQVLAHIPTNCADDASVYYSYMTKNRSDDFLRVRAEAVSRRGYDKTEEFNVSVIIPTKDHSTILKTCIDGIVNCLNEKITAQIIVVDNGSSDSEKRAIENLIAEAKTDIKYIYEPMEFNYSTMCNIGAKEAEYDNLLFLNDDVELVMEDTLIKLYQYASNKDIGAVGMKLLYPASDIIQHAGVYPSQLCGPTHKLNSLHDNVPYYFGRNLCDMNVLAVTGACLMVTKEKYFQVGGFSDKMGVGYNDVELCVKLYENGYRNVIVNVVYAFHHESLSRGTDALSDDKYRRLMSEREMLYDMHPFILSDGDPYYSVNLYPDTIDFLPNAMPEYKKRKSMSNAVKNPKVDKIIAAALKAEAEGKCSNGLISKLKRRLISGRIHFNIENTAFERGIRPSDRDCYIIEGWAIVSGPDNKYFRTNIALISSDGYIQLFDTFMKNREDVSIVFVKERSTELAGFVCRIPAEMIKKDAVYRLAVIRRSVLGVVFTALGDYYESARGYHTKEV